MRVAIDATLLGARFSGVERAVSQLLSALARSAADDLELAAYVGHGFDDYVRAFHPQGIDPSGRLQLRRLDLDNRNRAGRLAWQQLTAPRLVHHAKDDLFHAPAYLCPLAMSVPRVLTVYDTIALDQPEFAARANRWNYRFFLPACLRRAEAIIAPTAAVGDAIVQHCPEAMDRLHIVPLGVEPRFAQVDAKARAESVERFDLPERYVLWVGNIEPKKNVSVLLRAWAALGQQAPHLLLAGALSWGAEPVVKEWLALGLQAKVRFLGRVNDALLPALYSGARALVFPSLAEGFGLPPLEAMAAGVPVAVSRIPALAEVVGQAGLLVEPNDVEGWVEAVAALCDDRALAERLAAAGRERAAEYSWDRTARQTLVIYREVFEQRIGAMPRKKRDQDGTMWAGGTPDFDERSGTYRRGPAGPGALAGALRKRIDGWLKAHDRNEFGDPSDTVYAGGTPLFDERTGETKDRYDYILERHPEAGEWEE